MSSLNKKSLLEIVSQSVNPFIFVTRKINGIIWGESRVYWHLSFSNYFRKQAHARLYLGVLATEQTMDPALEYLLTIGWLLQGLSFYWPWILYKVTNSKSPSGIFPLCFIHLNVHAGSRLLSGHSFCIPLGYSLDDEWWRMDPPFLCPP